MFYKFYHVFYQVFIYVDIFGPFIKDCFDIYLKVFPYGILGLLCFGLFEIILSKVISFKESKYLFMRINPVSNKITDTPILEYLERSISYLDWLLINSHYIYGFIFLTFLGVGLTLCISNLCINGVDNNGIIHNVVCHIIPPLPPLNPFSLSKCYSFNYNWISNSIDSISFVKFKSLYLYQVFGVNESYTTSLTFKVPYFVHDSKMFFYIGDMF